MGSPSLRAPSDEDCRFENIVLLEKNIVSEFERSRCKVVANSSFVQRQSHVNPPRDVPRTPQLLYSCADNSQLHLTLNFHQGSVERLAQLVDVSDSVDAIRSSKSCPSLVTGATEFTEPLHSSSISSSVCTSIAAPAMRENEGSVLRMYSALQSVQTADAKSYVHVVSSCTSIVSSPSVQLTHSGNHVLLTCVDMSEFYMSDDTQ